MGQSKFNSILEAAANQVVAISYAVLIYMYLGWTPAQGLALTLVFSVVGFVRSYVIRRIAEFIERNRV